jgi:hypothetical protein
VGCAGVDRHDQRAGPGRDRRRRVVLRTPRPSGRRRSGPGRADERDRRRALLPVPAPCTGCTYFRTDPSYTPELRAYLAQLLTDSERLATAIPALADWARADATPSDEAIDAVRRLLRANDEVLTALDDEDRAAVEEAITAIRTQRATLDTTFPTELRGLTGPQPAVFFPTIERRAAASGSGHG